MARTSAISSARFHKQSSHQFSEGAAAVANYLRTVVGEDYTEVEVDRLDGRFTLIVDSDWVRLAQAGEAYDPSLLDGLDLPRNCLLAVVAGWSADWHESGPELAVHHSHDRIPHLRLTSLRPSPSGTDGNASRS